MKKILSAVLATTLLVSMLAGCGNSGTTSSPASASPSASASASTSASASASTPAAEPAKTNVNEFGWEVPEKTLKLNILDVFGGYAPMEAEKKGAENTKKYFLEHFNVEFNTEYTTGDGKEAANMALAAGSYPDIITGVQYDIAERFVKQKKAFELTPYMDTIAKDIKTTMGDIYPLFLNDENKIFYVPYMMGAISELPDNSAHIRYDEWKAIGSPDIKTPDDYYNAINAVLKLNPKTPNGETRYAMSLYTEPNGLISPDDMVGHWGLKSGYKISDAGEFTHWAFTEEGKEMSKFFNRFYRDGTLDPEAFINNFEQWKTKFSNERIAGCIGPWWITSNAGHEVWQSIDKNSPEEKRYIQVSFKGPNAATANLSGKNRLGSRYTVITDKAKDPEALLKFINFQATERGRAITCWGLPNGTPIAGTDKTGKFWNIDKDGKWEVDPVAKQQLVTETWSYDNAYNWESGIPLLFTTQDRWPDGEHNMWPNQMWYSENKWKSLMIKNMEGTIFDASAINLRQKTDEIAKIEQAIKDARRKDWPAVVQAKDDAAFDAAWDNLQKSMTAAGIEKYQTARSENYKKNLAKGK
ncbi:MAG: hypothetical protein RR185_06975 [Angelakisella sp.]